MKKELLRTIISWIYFTLIIVTAGLAIVSLVLWFTEKEWYFMEGNTFLFGMLCATMSGMFLVIGDKLFNIFKYIPGGRNS